MPADDTRSRIKRVLVEHLRLDGIAPESLGDDQPLFGEEGLGLDSVDALELVVALEKEFGVRIEDQDVDQDSLASVAHLAALVAGLRAGEGR